VLFDRIYRNSGISRPPNSSHIGQREFLTIAKPPCELGWSTAGHAAVPLSRPLGPGLKQRERSAPTDGLLQLGLRLLAQPLQVACVHEREQPCLKGRGELKSKAQVWMSGRECHDLGPHVAFDAEAAK
jgi:hypothetical protein